MIRLLSFLGIIFPLLSFSSVGVNGNFEAHKSCPAYVSKNKKNNPGGLMVTPSQNYVIREINRPVNPDWLRIEFPNTEHSLRWVSADCGEYRFDANGKTSCEQIPGLADSHVLALSWQPGFCQTYGYEVGKPECVKLPSDSYQATHLVLHGLWPNQQICGEHYGFCGVEAKKHHCDYPPVNLNKEVAHTLQQFMPSYAAGGCLERHEWNKHGSCQILSSDAYFSLATRLNQEMNQTALGQFLHEHVGETIKRERLRTLVSESFGQNTARKVYFGCKNGILVDIFINLPALIPQSESLPALVSKAPDFERYDGCPANIAISDFSSDSWY
ncbi:ribonuclease T2 family protein [Legionella hackeliae]|uniref:Ribonuclease, T2 family n=1 Tax=Legionella hackeliae TaxID=449 RepID=A0A0A8UX39_LEGHA|nr:ribonuclease T [Legionella hackeliae]KTD12670.1 ribonuclease, T2 family [Legionella hackeliae]CEK12086.1 Ribonuclease, T2 family [Legionella hackeliae]STX48875.1 ribonuclease, T2 family [Legionella hackeliae]